MATALMKTEHWIGIRMAPGHDEHDLADLVVEIAGDERIDRVETQSLREVIQERDALRALIEETAETMIRSHPRLRGWGKNLRERAMLLRVQG